LVVPLMAGVLPARSPVGVLLGMLITGDLFTAGYYRRHAHWRHVVRLLPAALTGIAAGYFILKVVSDRQLKPIIGRIVLLMPAVNYWRTRGSSDNARVPQQSWFAAGVGFLAGVATTMANAAGAIMVIYLVAMRLPKVQFVGTGAWFFFLINWIEVPFLSNLQLLTIETVKLDLMMLPPVAVGAAAGIVLLRCIPHKLFTAVVQILV
jgi:uncharacterized membrane protein YfcA